MTGAGESNERIPLPDPRCGRTRTADLGGIVLTEFRLRPEFHLGFHRHDASALFLWQEGRMSIDLGPEAWTLTRKGEILALPAGLVHREWAGRTGGRCIMIQGAEGSPERSEIEEIVGAAGGGVVGPIEELPEILEEAVGGELGVRGRLRARAACLELVAGLDDYHPGQGSFDSPPWLRAVARWIDEHYLDDWSLEALADSFGVSPGHLSRSFREEYGATVGERIRELRLDSAARRLRDDDLSIADIATESGFSDQSHLTRHFKRHFGTTPARYRRAAVRPG